MIKGFGFEYASEDIQKACNQGIENGKYEAKKEFEMYNIAVMEENKETLRKQYDKGFEKGSDYVREYIKQNKLLQNQREEDIKKLSFNDGYRVGKKDGYREGFTLAKEDITKLNEQERQQIYYEGYDSGHNQWQNDYGFTIPNNTIKNLEATNYKKGLKDKAQINEAVKQNIANKAFKEGYAQAYSEINAPTTERERQLQEKAWDEGYVSAIEDYLAQGGDFVGNVGCYEFGAIDDTDGAQIKKELSLVEKYPHYYKDIRHLNIIDIYRFFDLFNVKDPCLQHSIKKMAVGGKRGSKDYEKDIKEAMDTLNRWEYMQDENKRGLDG